MRKRIIMKKIYFIAIIFSAIITSNFQKVLAEQTKEMIERERQTQMQNNLIAAIEKTNDIKGLGYSYKKEDFEETWNLLNDLNDQDKVNLMAISFCESNYRADAHNTRNRNGTHDGGLFQINSIHKASNVFDPLENKEIALSLYKKNGMRDWNSSKKCWNSVLENYNKIS